MQKRITEEEEYKSLLESILRETEEAGFPFMVECMKPEDVTLEEIREMIVRLNMDTGLDVSFKIGLNGDRGMVHCLMTVDELPENKKRGRLLLQ